MREPNARDDRDRGAFADVLRIYGPAVVLIVVAFAVAYQFVDPAPPNRITIATGAPDGAYARFAEEYRAILARVGVTLDVRASAGSVENLRLLEDPESEVDVAFVQGGLAMHAPSSALVALASLYYEPMWVFHRDDFEVERITDFAGARVAVGPQGSGTRAVALTLLEDNGLGGGAVTITAHGGVEAAELLATNALDVAFVVASPRAQAVLDLLLRDGVSLLNLERADAYARQHRFVTKVILPEGAIDLGKNIPPSPTALVATTANLVARETIHPALIDLLLQAADEVHRRGGMFESAGEFPSPRLNDFPLSSDARRFFDSGPPFLRRTLPFWAATLLDRLLVMILPLIAIAIPLFKIMPAIYRWRMRSRIYRWYKLLRAFEDELRQAPGPEVVVDHLRGLSDMEREVEQLSVPWSFAEELYQLRVHIEMVRGRLERFASGAQPSATHGERG